MTAHRPLTSQEIDDGWCLDDEAPPTSDEPYAEFVLIETPSSAFEQAFWEQHEGRKIARPFGEVPADFGKTRRALGTFPPPDDAGN